MTQSRIILVAISAIGLTALVVALSHHKSREQRESEQIHYRYRSTIKVITSAVRDHRRDIGREGRTVTVPRTANGFVADESIIRDAAIWLPADLTRFPCVFVRVRNDPVLSSSFVVVAWLDDRITLFEYQQAHDVCPNLQWSDWNTAVPIDLGWSFRTIAGTDR
jgi:hypothetical protein